MRLSYLRALALILATMFVLAACTVNQRPTASFTVAPGNSGDTTTEFSFDASGSSDPDGSIASYEWDFGDGNTTSGQTVTYQFAATGTYTVSLTVADDKDLKDISTTTVEVLEPGTLSGYVVNRKAGTAVAGSTVTVEGTSLSTTTDANGFYSLNVPLGTINVVFSQNGYASSRVEGIQVESGQALSYDTIQAEAFDPFLPTAAPTLDIDINNGDSISGDATDDSFVVTISGSTVNPEVNGFVFADVGIGQVGGSSGYLNGFIPHERVFGFDGSNTKVSLLASGFDGDTTIHVIAYDQNNNRTEIIRYVSINSSFPGGSNLATIDNFEASAVTFGDTSIFGPLGIADLNTRDLRTAVKNNDFEALRKQAQLIETAQSGLQTQGFLDEVITWVDLFFDYDFSSADLPTAFEIYRQLEGEADFKLIGRLDPSTAYLGGITFGYRDSTPALQAGVATSYRVDAVTGSDRVSSTTFSVTPLPPFYVEAVSPANGENFSSVLPDYEMTFIDRSDQVVFGVIVLDRVQAEDNFLEWLAGLFLDNTGATSVAIPHNFDGTASTPTLQPYHAYDWQPVAITANADFSAISVAADFYDRFEVGFGVEDGPVNTFLTGDGSY